MAQRCLGLPLVQEDMASGLGPPVGATAPCEPDADAPAPLLADEYSEVVEGTRAGGTHAWARRYCCSTWQLHTCMCGPRVGPYPQSGLSALRAACLPYTVCCTHDDLIILLHLLLSADMQHVNTNAQLEKQLKGLKEAGVAELFEDDMPVAALLIRCYEQFMQLLPPDAGVHLAPTLAARGASVHG